MIFVFGSNTAGIHGAGAAKDAVVNHGAIYGQGTGPQGNSYAIATRTVAPDPNGRRAPRIVSLSLEDVEKHVESFLRYAKRHPELEFQVTQIGTGHAGFTTDQMAPLFSHATNNCLFDEAWKPVLGDAKRYWGTFAQQQQKLQSVTVNFAKHDPAVLPDEAENVNPADGYMGFGRTAQND